MKISADGCQGLPSVVLHRELVAPDNKGEEVPKEIRLHIFPLFRFQRTGDEILGRLPPAVDDLRASDVCCRSLVRPSLGRHLSSKHMLPVIDMVAVDRKSKSQLIALLLPLKWFRQEV